MVFDMSDLKFTGTPYNLTKIAKTYQFDVFYERERKLWNENNEYHGLPLQIWLYHNRLKYLGKSPLELSKFEIVRGFTISGILKGYTAFDTSLMHCVIEKYDVTSVYDPCAGWGERMLYCRYHDIIYHGVDVNKKLQSGYQRLMHDFDVQNQHIVFGDSSMVDLSEIDSVDAVITCPPYGSIEVYSEYGAENLLDQDFLKWWSNVVCNALVLNIKYFCFQINRKWRDRMVEVVLNCGFDLIDEFYFDTNKSSHFTRRNGVDIKCEYESMLVFHKG